MRLIATLTMALVMSFVTALAVWTVTQPPGPGLDPDAMAYVGAARSLVADGSLRVPTGSWAEDDSTTSLSLWPPGFPAAIALPTAAGVSPIQSARWITILAAAISAAAIVVLVGSVTTPIAGVIAAIVVFVTPAVFNLHIAILSEPLFLACLVLTAIGMVVAREQGAESFPRLVRVLGHPIVLGALATAAVMTRYAGAAAVVAVVLWMLLDESQMAPARFRRALLTALVPAVTISMWVMRTASHEDRHGTPTLNVYGGWGKTLSDAGTTLVQWLVPFVPGATDDMTITSGTSMMVRIGLAIFLGVSVILLLTVTERDTAGFRLRTPQSTRIATLLGACAMLAACYVGMIVASRAFVGGTIPFDWRILSPLIMLLEIMIVVALAHWWHAVHRPIHVLISAVAVAWIVASATMTVRGAMAVMEYGWDFAATEWRMSPLLAWVRAYGQGRTVYSNWPAAVYFHTGRIARELPDSTQARTELDEFAERFRASRGVLVGFSIRSPDVVAPDSLARRLGFREAARSQDGSIWVAP